MVAEEIQVLGENIFAKTKRPCFIRQAFLRGKFRLDNPYKKAYDYNRIFLAKGGYMARVTFKDELCKGCGLCVSVCPKKIVHLSGDRLNAKGYHPAQVQEMDKCIGCAFCATMCPDCVIAVEK
jgi:2-oxoglutarate ferredoxin oxidoreductase subunit delta